MFTYSLLNLAVMGVLVAIMLRWRAALPLRPLFVTVVALLFLTLVFDALIIYFDIVAYDPALMLPVRIINIPPEDFAYAIVAAVFMPYLSVLLNKNKVGDSSAYASQKNK